MKPGKPGHVSCLAMLADDKLAFCTSLSPSYRHDRGAVVPNPTPPSIRIADLAERQIRMLWPRRRSVTDWRIVTWSEREIRN